MGVVKRILTTFLQYNDRAILYIILPWWIWKSQFSSMLSMLQHQFMDYLISPATHQVSNLNILTKKSLSEVRISWFILCQAFKVSSYSCNCFCSYSWQAPVTTASFAQIILLLLRTFLSNLERKESVTANRKSQKEYLKILKIFNRDFKFDILSLNGVRCMHCLDFVLIWTPFETKGQGVAW